MTLDGEWSDLSVFRTIVTNRHMLVLDHRALGNPSRLLRVLGRGFELWNRHFFVSLLGDVDHVHISHRSQHTSCSVPPPDPQSYQLHGSEHVGVDAFSNPRIKAAVYWLLPRTASKKTPFGYDDINSGSYDWRDYGEWLRIAAHQYKVWPSFEQSF